MDGLICPSVCAELSSFCFVLKDLQLRIFPFYYGSTSRKLKIVRRRLSGEPGGNNLKRREASSANRDPELYLIHQERHLNLK